jgi:hypothetical protein
VGVIGMSAPVTRRPLPALVLLIVLTLLTALVWWRLLQRDGNKSKCGSGPVTTTLPAPALITVTVLNSTDRKGLARTAADQLQKAGFKISTFGNDIGHAPIPGVAEIRFSTDQADAATLLRYYIRGATMAHSTGTAQGVLAVSMGMRFHAVTPDKVVAAALAAHHIVASTTPGSASSSGC